MEAEDWGDGDAQCQVEARGGGVARSDGDVHDGMTQAPRKVTTKTCVLASSSGRKKQYQASSSGKADFLEGIGGVSDQKHLASCPGCPRCAWIKNREKWIAQCGDWLVDKLDMSKKTWGIGCKACARFVGDKESQGNKVKRSGFVEDVFSKFAVTRTSKTKITLQRLIQHKNNVCHQAAVTVLDVDSGQADIDDEWGLPLNDQWETLYSCISGGSTASAEDGVDGVVN